jgi:hypothetical protein
MCSQMRYGWAAVEFFSFSLMPLKFTSDIPKNNCVLQFVVLSILALLLFITIYLAFNAFWSFFFISSRGILFNLIFLLLIALFLYFILFLIIICFQFHHLLLYCIYFFNPFFVLILFTIFLSFSWFIFSSILYRSI